MEIAGFPHYENVCSNILKFYFSSDTNLHNLDDLLLRSLLQAVDKNTEPFTHLDNVKIKREFVTNKGRVDLVIYNNHWLIIIENKIRHFVNNDLEEYSEYLEKQMPNLPVLKIVLSIDKESNLKGGFINIRYKNLIRKIEENLQGFSHDRNNHYFIFFQHFLETIKNLYMPIPMDRTEIEFLINNQAKVDEIIRLEKKFDDYVNQRAHYLKNSIELEEGLEKWVYDGYDVGFHYTNGNVRYKIECLLQKPEISITICVEINTVNDEELEKLDYFRERDIKKFSRNNENNRLIIEDKIDFFIPDDMLINKLQALLKEIKITEKNSENFE